MAQQQPWQFSCKDQEQDRGCRDIQALRLIMDFIVATIDWQKFNIMWIYEVEKWGCTGVIEVLCEGLGHPDELGGNRINIKVSRDLQIHPRIVPTP